MASINHKLTPLNKKPKAKSTPKKKNKKKYKYFGSKEAQKAA